VTPRLLEDVGGLVGQAGVLSAAPEMVLLWPEAGMPTAGAHLALELARRHQRQAVAVARAVAFGSQVIILDEPTAALGVNESARVLKMIQDLRERGLSVILISHNMPQVFEVADRIHVARLGKRAAVVTPRSHSMNDVVAIMTGAMTVPDAEQQLAPVR
jgi:fructose transport system ATP-binding protein